MAGLQDSPGFLPLQGGFVGARVEELGEGWRSESDRLKGDVRDAGELGAQPVALTVETEPNRAQLREGTGFPSASVFLRKTTTR